MSINIEMQTFNKNINTVQLNPIDKKAATTPETFIKNLHEYIEASKNNCTDLGEYNQTITDAVLKLMKFECKNEISLSSQEHTNLINKINESRKAIISKFPKPKKQSRPCQQNTFCRIS